jgi:hypothetical protein
VGWNYPSVIDEEWDGITSGLLMMRGMELPAIIDDVWDVITSGLSMINGT